jgi:hypothetical protein
MASRGSREGSAGRERILQILSKRESDSSQWITADGTGTVGQLVLP